MYKKEEDIWIKDLKISFLLSFSSLVVYIDICMGEDLLVYILKFQVGKCPNPKHFSIISNVEKWWQQCGQANLRDFLFSTLSLTCNPSWDGKEEEEEDEGIVFLISLNLYKNSVKFSNVNHHFYLNFAEFSNFQFLFTSSNNFYIQIKKRLIQTEHIRYVQV